MTRAYLGAMIPALWLLIGCVPEVYTAPELGPDEASARIVADSPEPALVNSPPRLYVSTVDDRSTLRVWCWDFCWPAEVVVPVGRHHIGLHYDMVGSFADTVLWLDAEAGVTYAVRKKPVAYEIHFWLEDTRTGKTVGGLAGSEP